MGLFLLMDEKFIFPTHFTSGFERDDPFREEYEARSRGIDSKRSSSSSQGTENRPGKMHYAFRRIIYL